MVKDELDSELLRAMEGKEIEKAYDGYCKSILSFYQVLSRICKACIPEFKDVPLEDIPQYLIGYPQKNGNIKSKEKIQGWNPVDRKVADAEIRMDMLIRACLPKEDAEVHLIINLEAQSKDCPGYPLIERGVYYGSRLISGQMNDENGFPQSAYGKIKKVYSIWICTDHSKQKDNVFNSYRISETCHGVNYHAPKNEYDLMEIITLYPAKEYDYEGDEHDILEMLNIFFVSDMPIEMKKQHLEKNYGILMTKEIEKEVDEMCNLSQGVLARGIEQGFMQGKTEGKAEGIVEGKAEGKAEGIAECIQMLTLTSHITIEEAMDMLKVADDIRPAVLEIIEKMK